MSEESREQAISRAVGHGSLWLNEVFVVRGGKMRLWRRSSIRLSLPELVWIGLVTFVSAALIVAVVSILQNVPVLDELVSWFLVLGAPVIGWLLGRRIARASPYRRHSGEGLGSYLMVQNDKKGVFLGRVVGRRVAVNRCETFVSGKREVVDCVEWVGTSRAPLMPRFDPNKGASFMEVLTPPSCVPTPWVEQVRDSSASLDGVAR